MKKLFIGALFFVVVAVGAFLLAQPAFRIGIYTAFETQGPDAVSQKPLQDVAGLLGYTFQQGYARDPRNGGLISTTAVWSPNDSFLFAQAYVDGQLKTSRMHIYSGRDVQIGPSRVGLHPTTHDLVLYITIVEHRDGHILPDSVSGMLLREELPGIADDFCAKTGEVWDEKVHGCSSLASVINQSRREVICHDEQGTLYKTEPGIVVREAAGFVDVFEILDGTGTSEYSDERGVDWALMEGCHVAFLFYNSPATKSVALFAPEGFNLRSLYSQPYMGAKKVRVNQSPTTLTIEVVER